MLVLLMLFDTFYTMYSLNQTALFPEMYQDLEQRAKANNIVQVIGIIALIFAIVVPSFFIPQYDNPKYRINYFYAGLFMAIITAVAAIIFIKFGAKERKEFLKDSENAPSFFVSLKTSIGNKSFRTYVGANLCIFYVFGMLTALAPLYGSIVLGIRSSFMISILLALSFLSAAGFMVVWNKISVKYGVKKGQMISMTTFIAVLIPFLFINDIIGGFIFFIIVGLGLAGALFFRAVTMAAIIDEDELNTGVRREGGYFGINALVIRLSTIAVGLTTMGVFYLIGMETMHAPPYSEQEVLGIRILFVVFPAAALGIGIYSMSRFPIDKEKYEKIKIEIEDLHAKKKRVV